MSGYNNRGGTTTPPLDMDIQIWYNKEVSQWRWTLTYEDDSTMMESGNSLSLETAMKDISITVDYIKLVQ